MVTHSIAEALFLADRVLVLSPRPGRLRLDLPVSLPRPREESIRYTPAFSELARQLRRGDRLTVHSPTLDNLYRDRTALFVQSMGEGG